MRAQDDQRWFVLDFLGIVKSFRDRIDVIAFVSQILQMPVICFEALGHIIRIGEIGIALDGYVIVIVEADQFA